MAYEGPKKFLSELGLLIRNEFGPAGADVEEKFLAALAQTPAVLPEVDSLMHAAPEIRFAYAKSAFESGIGSAMTAVGIVEPQRVADFINGWLKQEVLFVNSD